MSILKNILLGYKRWVWRYWSMVFVMYSGLWTVIESVLTLASLPDDPLKNVNGVALLIVISLLGAIFFVYPKKEIALSLMNDTCKVNIRFGDLFESKGAKVIPVSRHFYETDVVETSLQYQVIETFRKLHPEDNWKTKYQKTLKSLLSKFTPEDHAEKKGSDVEKLRFPLGTIAKLEMEDNVYLMFSLTETEKVGEIKNCTGLELWDALHEFWKQAKQEVPGMVINIPLLGSGVSDMKLSAQQLLKFNILSIVNGKAEGGAAKEINIILLEKYFAEIDLRQVERSW